VISALVVDDTIGDYWLIRYSLKIGSIVFLVQQNFYLLLRPPKKYLAVA